MGSPNTTTPAVRPVERHPLACMSPRTQVGWRPGHRTAPNVLTLHSLSPFSGAPDTGQTGGPFHTRWALYWATGWSEIPSIPRFFYLPPASRYVGALWAESTPALRTCTQLPDAPARSGAGSAGQGSVAHKVRLPPWPSQHGSVTHFRAHRPHPGSPPSMRPDWAAGCFSVVPAPL